MPIAPSPRSIEKDSDLFHALTRPKLLSSFPRDSAAYVRVDASLRAYWHQIFDICPRLLDLSGPDGMAIYHPFMEFVQQQNLTLDWSFYLWMYELLKQTEYRDKLNDELLLELMGAAAARWAILDRGRNCGIVIGCREVSSVVVGWKCNKVDEGRQVELMEVDGAAAPKALFGHFFLPDFEFAEFPGWRDVPK
jgi:uncharacterized repeat protein (TIGR04061 family)